MAPRSAYYAARLAQNKCRIDRAKRLSEQAAEAIIDVQQMMLEFNARRRSLHEIRDNPPAADGPSSAG
jgi:hypothetical protein